MKYKVILLVILVISAGTAQNYLDSLQQHPRLLLLEEDVRRLNNLAQTDTLLAGLIAVVKNYADVALTQPLVKYEYDSPGSDNLKRERRHAMFRVFNCGVTWRLSNDTTYAHRVRDELLSAASFPDWGPQKFLNVGEMSAWVAIGYDWVYDILTPVERDSVRKALVKFSLNEGEKAYKNNAWWRVAKNNWNQVCNGGLALAALAIAEDEPDLANSILDKAFNHIPLAMEGYKPDGAWYEGPTYWAYGTTYNALYLDAMATALKNAIDVTSMNGYKELGKSGSFHIHTVGPSNLYYNFGDSKTTMYYSPVLFWMSQNYDEEVYAWYERWIAAKDIPRMHQGILMEDDTLDRFLALLVVWYDERGQDLDYNDLPLDAHFRGETAVAAFRTGWENDAMYIGFKGGYNQANHGHLDIGSFVLDANEVRWATDLGYGNNDLPGYFDRSGPRWQYYRCNNYSHNTMLIGGHQDYYAQVDIDDFYTSQDSAYALIDMTDAIDNYAQKAQREFIMSDRRKITIRDSVIGTKSYMPVRWQMVTATDIELFGNQALLSHEDKTMKVEILSPSDKSFSILSTDPGDGIQNPNDGTAMLAIEFGFNEIKDTLQIVVQFTPEGEISGIDQPVSAGVIKQFTLYDNYPNPFNPVTTISFNIDQPGLVRLDIFNVTGQKINTLVNQNKPAGTYQVEWNGTNIQGSMVSSGTYFYRLTSNGRSLIKKMILLR